jgi:hypothetical protein
MESQDGEGDSLNNELLEKNSFYEHFTTQRGGRPCKEAHALCVVVGIGSAL